jgi:UV DNA damage repair endonuclease
MAEAMAKLVPFFLLGPRKKSRTVTRFRFEQLSSPDRSKLESLLSYIDLQSYMKAITYALTNHRISA